MFFSDQDETAGSVFTTLAKAVSKTTDAASSDKAAPEQLEASADALARKRNAMRISLPDDGSAGGSGGSGSGAGSTTTGEEGERIALELTCAAYVFNRDSKQWTPIGQSYLHLNDDNDSASMPRSRLIIRLQSTRRVVVNTRVWSEMPVASVPESKAVRVGAMAGEGGGMRTYMLRFPAVQTANRLFEALEERKACAEELETVVVQKKARLEDPVEQNGAHTGRWLLTDYIYQIRHASSSFTRLA